MELLMILCGRYIFVDQSIPMAAIPRPYSPEPSCCTGGDLANIQLIHERDVIMANK